MNKKKKRKFRGIQINPTQMSSAYYYQDCQFQSLTVDCHLGSLIITKDELLDYLEQRASGNNVNKHTFEKMCQYAKKLETENGLLAKEIHTLRKDCAQWRKKFTDRWRDIQEELPQRDGVVLVYAPSQKPKTGLTALAWYNPEKGWSNLPNQFLSAITHWQPIPSPPAGKAKTESYLRSKVEA